MERILILSKTAREDENNKNNMRLQCVNKCLLSYFELDIILMFQIRNIKKEVIKKLYQKYFILSIYI